MGGDHAPQEIVKGALQAHEAYGAEIVLIGQREAIEPCLTGSYRPEIIDAREVVTMEDDPSTATRRKKDSSMAVALRMLKNGEGDAVVSAGSTGALLSGATLTTKRIRGIRRAAFAPVLPNGGNGCMLIDCGANAECTPEYLLQFAYMGSFYMQKLHGVQKPRVGLLCNGTEEHKGDTLRHDTYPLLQKAHEEGRICFVGNAEANQLFTGDVDVLVTDGFTGNVYLKAVEGMGKFMKTALKETIFGGGIAKVGALFSMKGIKKISKQMDYREVGGSPLLGSAKPVFKAHGSSDALAFRQAIWQAESFARHDVNKLISDTLAEMGDKVKGESDK